MYGLDKGTDLAFLVGRSLIQICVGLYQIILNFDDGVSISIEGTFEHISDGILTESGMLPEAARSLLGLIRKKIEAVRVIDGGTLEIKFSDGSTLRLHDSNPDAESYQISNPSGDIVV